MSSNKKHPHAPSAPLMEEAPKKSATQEQRIDATIVADVKAELPHAKPGKVLFVSKNKDLTGAIQVNGKSYVPTWTKDKTHRVWVVDKEDAEMFSKHTLVLQGRILRALD